MPDLKKIYNGMSKKEKTIAYISAAFLLLAFFDGFILKTILSKVNSIEEDIKAKELQLKKDLKLIVRRNLITQQGEFYSQYSIEAKSQEEEVSSVLKDIETLAVEAKVNLIEVKPMDLKSEKIIKRYSISLVCEAKIEELATFMHLLENSKTLFTIDSYSLVSKDKEKGILRGNLLISKIIIS